MKPIAILIIGILLHCLISASISASETKAFFWEKVQPIFERACFECHSHKSEKVKGGLFLDTKSGWQSGGNSGAVILPGDPESSLLVRAIRHVDDLKMPPKKQLSETEIGILERWIASGAMDPREIKTPLPKPESRHWAFLPIDSPPIPEVKNRDWVQSPIDAFVLDKLEKNGLQPSRRADRSTLIRRAYFDLIGLPPSVEAIARFEKDPAPDAFSRLIDRLLASPKYGERWARHWLDIARYADTKGYVFEEERRFPYAYTYRDYVIESFNADLPYDEFIIEQLAADLCQEKSSESLAAMGFLTLGRRFLNNQHDIMDDRIDVVSRGLMGLTVACARCHDHKYDPIPIADYYSLYGVFASSMEPAERPILSRDVDSPLYRDFEKALKIAISESDDYRITHQKKALSLARKQSGDYLLALFDARGGSRSDLENLVKSRQLGPVIAFRWQDYLRDLENQNGEAHPIFSVWIAANSQKSFAENFVMDFVKNAENRKAIHPILAARLLEKNPSSIPELAAVYGDLFRSIEEEWQAVSAETKALSDPDREQIRQVLYDSNAPASIPLSQATQLLEVKVQQRIRALKRKVDGLPANHPGAPPRAMSLVDRPHPIDPVIFLRGKPEARGAKVPRQFLSILSGENRKAFESGSGRLELANAIADSENPLTSRVIVNRLWRQHFGSGLVSTPSDFGLRADPPSHPQLLDYLADRFIKEGWSIKRMHRLMMLSSTYQQSSDPHISQTKKDPNNRLLWRMNRRRLELEALRDTLLWVAQNLDTQMGGQPVEITGQSFSPRRTIYGFIERQNLPALFRTFDLASPDSSSSGRFETTVPQQALFMTNSPFIQNLARHLESVLKQQSEIPSRQVELLFQKVLQRLPNPTERQAALDFLLSESIEKDETLAISAWQYGFGEMDIAKGQTSSFHPFDHFEKGIWKKSLTNDPQSRAILNAKGGHPDEAASVIRRWIAPYSTKLWIEGTLRHSTKKGNGIEAWIVSSEGVIAHWKLHNDSVNVDLNGVTIHSGQRLDFIIASRGEASEDAFDWQIELRAKTSPRLSDVRYWNSEEDFEGPQKPLPILSPLARLAQVLMMSNELAFVD